MSSNERMTNSAFCDQAVELFVGLQNDVDKNATSVLFPSPGQTPGDAERAEKTSLLEDTVVKLERRLVEIRRFLEEQT